MSEFCRSNNILNIFYLADRHKHFDKRLLSVVEKQDINLVLNVATREARKLYELHTNVSRAICKIKSFLRFEISKHGILYTKINSEHRIVDNLLYFFQDRFPTFYIAIEDNNTAIRYKKKTYVISPDKKIVVYRKNLTETVRLLESKLPVVSIMDDFSFDESLWEQYYDSQFIKERKNPKLMQSMMPLKYRQMNAKETLISKRCRSLSEFF